MGLVDFETMQDMFDMPVDMQGSYGLYDGREFSESSESYDVNATISTDLVQMLGTVGTYPVYPYDTFIGRAGITGITGRTMQPDALFVVLDSLVHWTAYFIACASVTISLLICMAVIMLSCVCLFELVAQGFDSAVCYARQRRDKTVTDRSGNRGDKNF